MTKLRHWDMMSHVADSLLTSAEVARLIGRTPRTVQRLVASGELKPAQKLPGVNGAYLFARRDVARLRKQFPVSTDGAA